MKVFTTIVDHIMDQAIAELPQIMDEDRRVKIAEEYINDMTNMELLALIDRANNE